MNIDSRKHKDFMETWPWLFPIQIIEIIIWNAGNYPDNSFKSIINKNSGMTWVEFMLILDERIKTANGELLAAKTRDERDTAKTKQKFWKEKKETTLRAFKKIAVEGFRLKHYIGYGFLGTDGIRTIILPEEWPQASMDWNTRSVVVKKRRYADVRFISCQGLLPDEIQHAINQDLQEREKVNHSLNASVPPENERTPPITVTGTLNVNIVGLEIPLPVGTTTQQSEPTGTGTENPLSTLEEITPMPGKPQSAESPEKRRERLLEWAKEELSLRAKKGTIQRVADREGVTRQRIKDILESFQEGQEFVKNLTYT
ncbi:MAG: hypothetical protein H7837_01765 [Magnetococcus sp. MYC-9]